MEGLTIDILMNVCICGYSCHAVSVSGEKETPYLPSGHGRVKECRTRDKLAAHAPISVQYWSPLRISDMHVRPFSSTSLLCSHLVLQSLGKPSLHTTADMLVILLRASGLFAKWTLAKGQRDQP